MEPITQGDEKISFGEFKAKLRSYARAEKFNANLNDDNMMMEGGWVRGRDKECSEIKSVQR